MNGWPSTIAKMKDGRPAKAIRCLSVRKTLPLGSPSHGPVSWSADPSAIVAGQDVNSGVILGVTALGDAPLKHVAGHGNSTSGY